MPLILKWHRHEGKSDSQNSERYAQSGPGIKHAPKQLAPSFFDWWRAIRKVLFWLHLSVGVAGGVFIFIMAASGVMLAFERQIVEFVDRDIRSVSVPNDVQPRPLNELLDVVRRSGTGDPTTIVLRNRPQAAAQFVIGRNKAVYVDPYCGAVLGVSSARAHDFFFAVERLHRALGAPLGSKTAGHWLAAISNLLFGGLILVGLVLWLPRKWNWNTVRGSTAFRTGLSGRGREWNWHNVVGIWCALPLLVIVLSGVVMSFEWENALLFRLTGSTPAVNRRGGEARTHAQKSGTGAGPNYEHLFTIAKTLNPNWRTITLNVVHDANARVPAVLDTGAGGQPQKRTQYVFDGATGTVLKTVAFANGSLGQRLRAFVRFGHTGEYGGLAGQTVAASASLGACVLVYSGLSLSIRRFVAWLKRRRRAFVSERESYISESVV